MEADLLPVLLAAGAGSLPDQGLRCVINHLNKFLPEIPFWPQFFKYNLTRKKILWNFLGLLFLRGDKEEGEIIGAEKSKLELALEKFILAAGKGKKAHGLTT